MEWQNERTLRKGIVEVHRRIYDLGFSVANDGNTSIRAGKDRILITPSGFDKASLAPQEIVIIDMNGKTFGRNLQPSSEIFIHLGIYRSRPDVKAIIHAHPPYAIACTLAGVSLEDYLLPEVILSLGTIPTIPYVTPGTPEAGEVVSTYIQNHDALMLDRHGSVTVGTTLPEAFAKLERIEHAAKILAIAKSMGALTPLPKPDVEKLIGKSVPAEVPQAAPQIDPKFVELVAEQVAAEFRAKKA